MIALEGVGSEETKQPQGKREKGERENKITTPVDLSESTRQWESCGAKYGEKVEGGGRKHNGHPGGPGRPAQGS